MSYLKIYYSLQPNLILLLIWHYVTLPNKPLSKNLLVAAKPPNTLIYSSAFSRYAAKPHVIFKPPRKCRERKYYIHLLILLLLYLVRFMPKYKQDQHQSIVVHQKKGVKKFQFLELSAPITKSLRQLTPRFLSWDSGTPIPHLLTFSPMISLWCKSSPFFFFFLIFSTVFSWLLGMLLQAL